MTTRAIWKFPLEPTDQQTLTADALIERVLSAGLDPKGRLCVWCEVDTGRSLRSSPTIYIVGTGNPMPFFVGDFVGSVTVPPFVWHVYVSEDF